VSTIHEQPTLEAQAPTEPGGPTAYQQCDSCGSAVDESQRYCVVCGTRRKHSNDPAARFLSEATKRRRTSTSPTAVTTATAPSRRSASFATAALIAVIPLALGAGVLIGRSSSGGDANLIAALKAQKAPVIQYSGTAPASGAAATGQGAGTAVAALVSTFKGPKGYAIQLGTLPSGTTQAAATKVERTDRAKGATSVGVISLSEFTVKPKPSSGAYVIYSGDYSTAQAANHALSALKHKFRGAKVIAVTALSTSEAATGGKVLTKTRYGSAHQVTSYKPSSAALKQGANVAAKDSHSTGKTASGVGLPDVVAVP
jgi:hypothetical protein